MPAPENIIDQTKKWITDVVIDCNFCPFANKVVKQNAVKYIVEESPVTSVCIENLLAACKELDTDSTIETTFLILPNGYSNFHNYLDLVEKAERRMKKAGYEGIYQLASFHPQYMFAGSKEEDAANYTNRSLYPMLHILREEKIEEALEHSTNPELIPEKNIAFAKKKGTEYMKMLRDSCLE